VVQWCSVANTVTNFKLNKKDELFLIVAFTGGKERKKMFISRQMKNANKMAHHYE
jgi:hypothetical protein